ncbi:MAG: type II toxin-antitoxin system RelE/ParE family toxin [Rugosibacter sp.]
MYSIKPLPKFSEWLNSLPDAAVRGIILARIKRLELGLMGDVEPIGDGVSELRIHFGAGWRIYFMQRGKQGDCLARGWFQTYSKDRHQPCQSTGSATGMTGENHDPTHKNS